MKKFKQVVCSILIISVILSNNTFVFATELSSSCETENTVISTTIRLSSDDLKARIPNAIEVAVKLVDDNHVKVCITNYGIDKFDKVSCYVEVWDTSGKKQYSNTITEKNIYPLFPRNNTIYVKNWSKIKISNIRCWDGDDYGTVANITYTKN